MKLPLWYKTKDGKWIILTHFPDGKIGLTTQQAVEAGLNDGPGSGMGQLDGKSWSHEWGFHGSRFFLLRRGTE